MARAVSVGLTAAIVAAGLLPGSMRGTERAVGQEVGQEVRQEVEQRVEQQTTAAVAIPAPTARVLQRMTRSAAVIFVGQVVAVRHQAGEDAAAHGIVTVEFRVDEAVRGCAQGSIYTLREWAGLWYAGGDRYRVGQRLLLFLHRPNAAGLSSPVQGTAGAVPLRGGGAAPGPYDARRESSEWLADLRWVQTQAAGGEDGTRQRSGAGQSTGSGALEREGEAPFVPVAGAGGRTGWSAMAAEPERAMQPLPQVLRLCRDSMEPLRAAR